MGLAVGPSGSPPSDHLDRTVTLLPYQALCQSVKAMLKTKNKKTKRGGWGNMKMNVSQIAENYL